MKLERNTPKPNSFSWWYAQKRGGLSTYFNNSKLELTLHVLKIVSFSYLKTAWHRVCFDYYKIKSGSMTYFFRERKTI